MPYAMRLSMRGMLYHRHRARVAQRCRDFFLKDIPATDGTNNGKFSDE